MKRILMIVLSAVLIASCSQNSKKEGGTVLQPDTAARTQQAPGEANVPAAAPKGGVMTVKTDEIIPEVAAKYKGIVLQVTNLKTKESYKVDVPFSTETALKDTPFSILVQSFIPHFTMGEGGVANLSMAEENPGAKVNITEGGKVIFSSWLFQKYPDAHGFTHPGYSIVMLNAIPK